MALAIGLAGVCVLVSLWPGDIQWVNDEPLLIGNALAANRDGRWVTYGLLGTAGTVYGPLPTWLYQLYLKVSHDLVALVVLKAFLSTALVAVALWWLQRTAKLWPYFPLAVVCSPYLYFYARVLWDNTLGIPLSAMAVAAHAAYLLHGRRFSLAVLIICCGALPLVHLMSVALVVPVAVHLLAVRWRSLWRDKLVVLGVSAVMVALSMPYVLHMRQAPPPSTGTHIGDAGAWLFGVQGARLISAHRIGDIFGDGWLNAAGEPWSTVLQVARAVSCLAYGLSALGAVVTVQRLVRQAKPERDGPRLHLGVLCLGIVVTQVLLDGLTDKHGYPHYFNATWVGAAVLAWLGVDALSRWRFGPAVPTAALAVALVVVTSFIGVRVHQHGGSRDGYGATLANQLEVVEQVRQLRPQQLQVEVLGAQRFPHAMRVLFELRGETPSVGSGIARRLTYAEPADPYDGRTVLQPSP